MRTAEGFESLYRARPDPWHFADSRYELNRYDVTLASLRRARYHRAFEPGCSIGVLTSKLAIHCDRLIASDVAPSALETARRRCASLTNVEFLLWAVEDSRPEERFDLIVFSEIGYYFSRSKLSDLAACLADSLEPAGEFLAVHWLGDSIDHVLHGDEVHSVLEDVLPLTHWLTANHGEFRVDGWLRDG